MKKHRKIGFGAYTDDDDQEPEENSGKTVEQLKTFIKQLYKPDGITEQKEFRTNLELKYELSEAIEASTKDVSTALSELGYEHQFIEGVPHWIMYTLPPNPLKGE